MRENKFRKRNMCKNLIVCSALFSLFRYFVISNYCWPLIEISQCIEEASKLNQVPNQKPNVTQIADYDFVKLKESKALVMPQHRSGRKTTKTNSNSNTKTQTQTTTVQVTEESDYDFAFEFQVMQHIIIFIYLSLFPQKRSLAMQNVPQNYMIFL